MFYKSGYTLPTMTSPVFASSPTPAPEVCTNVDRVKGCFISTTLETKKYSPENTSSITENSPKECVMTSRRIEGSYTPSPFTTSIEVKSETLISSPIRNSSYQRPYTEYPLQQQEVSTPTVDILLPRNIEDACIIDIEDTTNEAAKCPTKGKSEEPAKETAIIENDSTPISQLNEHSSASDIFSEVLHTLNPEEVYSRCEAQHGDSLKKFLAKVLCNGAAGTISADGWDYINQAKGAAGIICAMVAVGIVDGLYSCGKHVHEHKQQTNNILKTLGYGTYRCISPVMNLLPDTLCQCTRKAYIYGSLTGASATIIADFLSHLSKFAMTPSAASYITGYACPILLLALTSAGGIAGAISAYNKHKKRALLQVG